MISTLPLLLPGCIVDLGDNIVPPDLRLDEDFFYCRIQPEILTNHSCAGGGAGEMGSCHSARSALRLIEPAVPGPACAGDLPTEVPPIEAVNNLEAVRFTVQSDALSSPFYRRPTGLDSHPRIIFDTGSLEADLIEEWISRGSL